MPSCLIMYSWSVVRNGLTSLHNSFKKVSVNVEGERLADTLATLATAQCTWGNCITNLPLGVICRVQFYQ